MKHIKNYYHLTKPGIIYGNLISVVAGFLFASHWHNLILLIFTLIGAALVIGCGCVINNVIDKNIDKKMKRTQKRATVTGEISIKPAIIYGVVLGITGTVILGLVVNVLSMIVALFGLFVYVVIYGIAKRKTVYGTLVGAFAGAVPPLIGYTAFSNSIDLAGILIFFILISWQLTHFYAISLYRKEDYQKAALPVWSVVKGDWSTQLQAIGFIAVFTVFSISLYFFGYTGYIYLIATFLLSIVWLWYSVLTIKKLTPKAWGKKTFTSSLFILLAISILLAIGPILP